MSTPDEKGPETVEFEGQRLIVHPLTVSEAAYEKMLELIARPPEPTEALKALMAEPPIKRAEP